MKSLGKHLLIYDEIFCGNSNANYDLIYVKNKG